MSLHDDAVALVSVLRSIVASLKAYRRDSRSDYTHELAHRLEPSVDALEIAVIRDRSRETAQAALSEIAPTMHEVNAAATKGEMVIFDDDALNEYWHLHTIFRESRYAQEAL